MDDFLNEMKSLLGDEFDEFLKFYSGAPAFRALRVNTLKCTAEKLLPLLDFSAKPVPFCPQGFYIPEAVSGLGTNPLHHAGAFYIQEPSAMSAVELLGVQKGDCVLDLCAAPGGKSTQIAAKLGSSGLLWSNEIVRSRANVLLSNIERLGVANSVVSCCRPDVLCSALVSRFDKVLVDAPCSGEGMFRKNSDAARQWSREHVQSCAHRQLLILKSAASALKPGGVMVYSTCTFSREENEAVISRFLSENPDFYPDPLPASFGRETENGARRIFPTDGGEGHFAVRLRKGGEPSAADYLAHTYISEKPCADALEFYDSLFAGRPFGENIVSHGDKLVILPRDFCFDLNFDFRNIPVLRCGLLLGTRVKNRIEPHHSVFAASAPEFCRRSVSFELGSAELAAFLRGEEIPVSNELSGYTAVCTCGLTLGFGKASGGRLKNKYPKGLRNSV